MSDRLEVLENKPGVLRVNVVNAFKLIDGDITVTVQWSDGEGEGAGYWWARLDDAKGHARTVRYTPNADGSTQQEALAHLAIAAYVGLIEAKPDPERDPQPARFGSGL